MKSRKEELLTAERLREILDYDPETGVFRWKERKKGRQREKSVGEFYNGYRLIKINGNKYFRHRLAWLWVTGEWPIEEIDHINGKRGDDRFENLRQASHIENSENQRKAHKDNSCGILGVSLDRRCLLKPWRSHIGISGKQKFLGRFRTPEEAHNAYLEAKRKLHTGCTI